MFIISSLMKAFGLVIVEAVAWDKPFIGTYVGGIPDTIKNWINEYLVKPKRRRLQPSKES